MIKCSECKKRKAVAWLNQKHLCGSCFVYLKGKEKTPNSPRKYTWLDRLIEKEEKSRQNRLK